MWFVYLCSPPKNESGSSSLLGLVVVKICFLSLVKVVTNGKINLVGMEKRLTLHSQSKKGSQNQQFLRVKKWGETSGLKVHNLITYSFFCSSFWGGWKQVL